MAEIDYKFNQIKRNDDGSVVVDFTIYTGLTSELFEDDDDGNQVRIDRYRRSAVASRGRLSIPSPTTDDRIRSALNFHIDSIRGPNIVIPDQLSPAVELETGVITSR